MFSGRISVRVRETSRRPRDKRQRQSHCSMRVDAHMWSRRGEDHAQTREITYMRVGHSLSLCVLNAHARCAHRSQSQINTTLIMKRSVERASRRGSRVERVCADGGGCGCISKPLIPDLCVRLFAAHARTPHTHTHHAHAPSMRV